MGKRLLIFILILISINSYYSYSYGGPLGSNSVVLNQTCSQFCLYVDPFNTPGVLREESSCNSVSGTSRCSGGLVSIGIDQCSIAYGPIFSNTYSPFGYPILSGSSNIYGEAVCRCAWKSSGPGSGSCLPDHLFNPVSTDVGDGIGGLGGSFCDVTGNFSGVAGDVVWDRGFCSEEPLGNNVTDLVIENQIYSQGSSVAHGVDECECDSDYNPSNGIDHICNTARAGFSDCTRTSSFPQIQRKRIFPGGNCFNTDTCDNKDNDCNGVIDDFNNNRIADSACTYYYSCDLRYLECSKQPCVGPTNPLSPFSISSAYGYSSCTSMGQTDCTLQVDSLSGNVISRRFCNTSISLYAVGTNFYNCNSFNYTFNGCGLDKSVCNKTNLLAGFANISYANTESYANTKDCSKCGSSTNGCMSYYYIPSLFGSGTSTRAECSGVQLNMDSNQQACGGCAGITSWTTTGDYAVGQAGCCGDDINEVYIGRNSSYPLGPGACCKNASAIYDPSFSSGCNYNVTITTCNRASNNTLDIVFATDQSGSMSRTDPSYLRHTSIKEIIDRLNKTLDRVGFVPWGDKAIYFRSQLNWTVNLTSNFEFAKQIIDKTTLGSSSGTFFDLGLNYSINQFYNTYNTSPGPGSFIETPSQWFKENTRKNIIFLSDGVPSLNCGAYTLPSGSGIPGSDSCTRGGNFGSQALRANRSNITIYTIGLNLSETWRQNGSVGSANDQCPCCPGCAYDYLKEIANTTGGLFFDSQNPTFLDDAYNNITEKLFECVSYSTTYCVISSAYWTNSPPTQSPDLFLANDTSVSLVVSGTNCAGASLSASLREFNGAAIPPVILSSFNASTINLVFNQKFGGLDFAVVSWNGLWFDASGSNPVYVFNVSLLNQSLNSLNKLTVFIPGGPPIGRYIPDTQVVITREGECKDIGRNDGTGVVNETWRRINTTDNSIIEGPLTYEKACFLKKEANVPFFSLINIMGVFILVSVYYLFYLKKNKKAKRKHKKQNI